ncbi:MAG: EEP domain-containing protein, partial [Gammaproteobacteria bacterium]
MTSRDSDHQYRLPQHFSLLSYNIQMGVDTARYRDYVTQGWKHVLPHRARMQNLNRIAALLSRFDMVSLQEVDAGSLRCGFVDITEYLAHRADFPHWYRQVNRNIGVIARHSNGFLTRFEPTEVSHYKLPAAPGRGAMVFRFGETREAFTLCSMHLALGRRAREKQLGIYVIQEQRIQVSPMRFRVPDICVLSGGRPPEAVFTSPPFVCIEILSPEDRISRMQERVDDYLAFGVGYVWV